ncbi:MAG: hypothetical protein AAF558_06060 [Verrucomicrobiota bacterium]
MDFKRSTALFLTWVIATGATGDLFGQSAYPVPEKSLTITPSYSFSTYDRFKNSNRRSVTLRNAAGISAVEEHSFSIAAEYGITEDLTADLTMGYVNSTIEQGRVRGKKTSDGLDDTLLGVRYRFIDEAKYEGIWIPTMSVRLGAVLPGTYETALIHSPGEGAFGMSYSLLVGSYLEKIEAGYYGDINFLLRESVPDLFNGRFGIYKVFLDNFSVFFGYQRVQSLSGSDLGQGTFRDLKEVVDLIEYGFTFTDPDGRSYSIGASNVLDGKNTAESYSINASASFPF